MRPTIATMAETSDEELVALALAEAEYYGILMERYEAALTRYVARLGVRNREDQQDVLQEVFVKAYRNLNSFDQSLKFSSWLYRIAHNEAISWYRRQSVRPEGHLIDDGETTLLFTAADLSTDAAAQARLNAQELERVLAKLPEKYREVIILRFFEHKEYDEISDILRIPVGTVGTLLHRGKTRLREALRDEHVEL